MRDVLLVLGVFLACVVEAVEALTSHGPLTRVPENTLKFAVGVLLTSFGTFWGAEGAGAHWPGGDAALPVVIGVIAAAALALTAYLRRLQNPPTTDVELPDAAQVQH